MTIGDIVDATGAAIVAAPSDVEAAALRGRAFAAATIDSREVAPRDLFVALPGTRTDGTHFVGDAYARGALAALTRQAPALTRAQQRARGLTPAAGLPFASLVVPDPLSALQDAAAAWRAQHESVTVVGVTGSVGKTTTREAIASVLAAALPTLTSVRSYNNEIGLPLTLLGLERRHRAAVLEMGMHAPGEIAALAAMARPHIGVVTLVAPVHLARLGSIEAIAAAKAELLRALPPDGTAILNGDDPRVRAMAALTPARAAFYGLGADNDWRALDVADHGLSGFAFTLARRGRAARVETPVVGRHFVHALLAAAATAEALDVPWARLPGLLAQVRIGERQRLLSGPAERLIIDDSWNASVPSMLAALDVLAAVPRRRVAVLGEMLELGAESDAAHQTVGRRAGELLDALIAVGAGGLTIAETARCAGMSAAAVVAVPCPAEIPAAATALLRRGDAVLVKGSRGLHLEETVRWLMSDE